MEYISYSDIQEYTSLLTAMNAKLGLTEFEIYLLYKIGTKEFISAYKLYNDLKSTKYSIAYKNIHKRIKKFYSQKLIEKIEKKDVRHGSIYYKLTSFGLMYILYIFPSNLNLDKIIDRKNYLLEILKYYKNDSFCKLFVSPFWDMKNLNLVNDTGVLKKIIDYIGLCAQGIRDLIDIHDTNYSYYEGAVYNTTELFNETLEALAVKIMKDSSRNIKSKKSDINKSDIFLLIKDKKFCQFLHQVKKQFDNDYDTFINYEKKFLN
jgi:hypothetical protein